MLPSYFAQVTDGVVTDIRYTTKEYMDENPSLYQGSWIEIQSMDQYPGLGWTLNPEGSFQPTPE